MESDSSVVGKLANITGPAFKILRQQILLVVAID